MTWLWNPLSVPLFIGAIASFVISIHVWQRDIKISKSGALLLIASGFWILGTAFEVVGGDLETKLFLTKLQYVGICFVTPVWLILSIQFSGNEQWLTPLNLSILIFIPVAIFFLAITNEMHGLMWKDAWLLENNPFVWKSKSIGFSVLLIYSYLAAGAGIIITALSMIRTRRFYRWQVTVFLIVILIPLITHVVIDNLGYSPDLDIELTPFVLAIVVPAMTLGLIRWIEVSIVPVARNAVVENMKDGLIVLDFKGRIVDTNPAARKIMNATAGEIIGEQLDVLSSEIGAFINDSSMGQEFDVEILVDGILRTYNCEFSPLLQPQGQMMSRIFVLRDISERVRAEKKNRESLQEKEALLREIHHRVKNNLQLITSLLNLQIAHIKDEQIIAEIKESQNRILAISFVHEKLYQSEDLGKVDFGSYVNSLVNHLFDVYRSSDVNIRADMELDTILLDIDTAIPCGLIINELVTNVFKHAFPGMSSGRVGLKLWAEPGDDVHMLVRDDGVGIPPNFDTQNISSLGFQLIQSLVIQLDGQIEFDDSDGAAIEINFHHPQE
ncbi:MAG: PAS domain-containing protein [Anaerolineales bacterium]|nr:PAS domain-containing protein [Chloroflexota bacterium]MBL6981803.1 PAS domain-containing protein [Anaerolineales bacterium]